MLRVVILDRDGVINEDSNNGIRSIDEWRPLPGSLDAIVRLNQAHYHVVIVTNQSGIAAGLLSLDTLHQIHARLQQELIQRGGRIDAIYFCAHGPDDECQCRKPKVGLLRDLAKRLQLNLADTIMIGDSLSDLQAARTVKARSLMVRTGKGRMTEQQGEGLKGVAVFDDLSAAVDQLLNESA